MAQIEALCTSQGNAEIQHPTTNIQESKEAPRSKFQQTGKIGIWCLDLLWSKQTRVAALAWYRNKRSKWFRKRCSGTFCNPLRCNRMRVLFLESLELGIWRFVTR